MLALLSPVVFHAPDWPRTLAVLKASDRDQKMTSTRRAGNEDGPSDKAVLCRQTWDKSVGTEKKKKTQPQRWQEIKKKKEKEKLDGIREVLYFDFPTQIKFP